MFKKNEAKKETHKESAMFQVSQKLILYRADEKKYLLVKDADTESEFSRKYGLWELPGGRLDEDEDATSALQREIWEELGKDVQFSVIGPVMTTIMTFSTRQVFRVGLLAWYEGGDIVLSEENSEFQWRSAREIAEDPEIFPWLKEFIKAAEERLKECE